MKISVTVTVLDGANIDGRGIQVHEEIDSFRLKHDGSFSLQQIQYNRTRIYRQVQVTRVGQSSREQT